MLLQQARVRGAAVAAAAAATAAASSKSDCSASWADVTQDEAQEAAQMVKDGFVILSTSKDGTQWLDVADSALKVPDEFLDLATDLASDPRMVALLQEKMAFTNIRLQPPASDGGSLVSDLTHSSDLAVPERDECEVQSEGSHASSDLVALLNENALLRRENNELRLAAGGDPPLAPTAPMPPRVLLHLLPLDHVTPERAVRLALITLPAPPLCAPQPACPPPAKRKPKPVVHAPAALLIALAAVLVAVVAAMRK
jgi:hypothetical protein